MRSSDQMLARIAGEIEEKQRFIDGVVEAAEKEGRDLTSQEMELVTRSRDRQGELNEQAKPMQEAARISMESQERVAQIGKLLERDNGGPPAKAAEYKTAGEYVIDRWRAGLGVEEARNRLELYHRVAAHQTSTDTEGLLPEPVLGPVVNFIDQSRPLVSALGPRQLPAGTWSRPRITQHTNVEAQSAEKAELTSQKMIIEKVPVTAVTYGGYLNVSRQLIDWTVPQVMDIVIQDLAGQYAIETEEATASALLTAATAGATGLGTTPTDAEVAAAYWGAAGAVFTATQGAGRVFSVIAPDMLSVVGPLFAPYGPSNQQGTGFNAGGFSTGGPIGSISGIPVYVSSAITAGNGLILSSSAAEVYEDRIGALQVVEPSVLGVQVAYAGHFAVLALEADAIIKITLA